MLFADGHSGEDNHFVLLSQCQDFFNFLSNLSPASSGLSSLIQAHLHSPTSRKTSFSTVNELLKTWPVCALL